MATDPLAFRQAAQWVMYYLQLNRAYIVPTSEDNMAVRLARYNGSASAGWRPWLLCRLASRRNCFPLHFRSPCNYQNKSPVRLTAFNCAKQLSQWSLSWNSAFMKLPVLLPTFSVTSLSRNTIKICTIWCQLTRKDLLECNDTLRKSLRSHFYGISFYYVKLNKIKK